MTIDRRDALLDRDWSATWSTLPEAPDLVPRPKSAQITLRIPARLLARIKAVALAKSLPYHALTRAWVIEALRTPSPTVESGFPDDALNEQLNIKLDNDTLDHLKQRANELRRPYHRLAREWIEAALTREEDSLGIDATRTRRPSIKDLMVLLLHAPGRQGHHAIHGMTRLQKLLFVIEQKLAADNPQFYAYDYGPYNDQVPDAVQALKLAGFLRGAHGVKAGLPSFAEMVATAEERSGPQVNEEFDLSEQGHEAAERLRQSSKAYDELFAYVHAVRQEWDTARLDDLVDRVYADWPKYTDRSLIRGKVAARSTRRRHT